jgi:hypothetical protein
MDLRKSHWAADANRVSLAVPFAKVDRENRLVSGYATLDNIDTSDDVVTAEASKSAFSAFRGNIREMHQPIAAGRLVDFREDEFFHDGEFFRGIYVTVYVSKGAQDTWEKVLDGTLSGFSIGGNITDQESKFVKDAGPNGKTIRFIKGYDLIELSLVDNPANQLSNIDAVVKVFSIKEDSHGDMVMKGMVAETEITNVFWCPTDEIAKNSAEESVLCLKCGSSMEQIGWFEQGEDNAVKTAAAVADFLRQKEGNADTKQNDNTGEGGVNMADENKNDAVAEDVVTSGDVVNAEEVNAEQVAEGAQVPEDSAEVAEEQEAKREAQAEAAGVEEAQGEPDFEKMFDDLKGSVKESIEKTVAAVEAKVTEVTAAFDAKASEFEKSIGELGEKLEEISGLREDVAKRLDALEKASAIKKSGEVEGPEPVKKAQTGIWGGTFFDREDA